MTDFSDIPQFKSHPEEALAFFKEHGYQVEFDVWSPDQIAEINQAAKNIPERDSEDFRPLMHPHRKSDVFLKALRNPRVVALVEHLLEGEISGLQTEYFFGAPGTRGFANHQDNFYLEAKPEVFGSAWSPMTHVSPENGGVFIYPGTHREPILPVRPLEGGAGPNQDPNASNEESVVPEKYKPVDVVLEPGATVVFHGHLVHGSYVNDSDRFRNALLNTYIRKGEKFRAGFTAKRTEIPVHESA